MSASAFNTMPPLSIDKKWINLIAPCRPYTLNGSYFKQDYVANLYPTGTYTDHLNAFSVFFVNGRRYQDTYNKHQKEDIPLCKFDRSTMQECCFIIIIISRTCLRCAYPIQLNISMVLQRAMPMNENLLAN